MKIIFFTKYARLGASSRYRAFQYLPSLAVAGIQPEVKPLFDDAYLARKYAIGRTPINELFRSYFRRLWATFVVPRGSVVYVEYELLPYFPALLEYLLVWRGCRFVVDYDDALFHQYDNHSNRWIRRLLGGKIATVMRLARTVVAGNSYLADYARRAGASRVTVIPTVIDLQRYPVPALTKRTGSITIVWIGSPSTSKYLLEIVPALAEVCKSGQVKVRLIGSGNIDLPGVPVEHVPWCEDTEVEAMQSSDIGIMPLPDELWERGKCGFKLIQYMACGLPVVASPVGVNADIIEPGVNGFLASTHQEWVAAFQTLVSDSLLRERMGQAGRAKVEQNYCLQVTAPRLAKVLLNVTSS